MRDQIEEVPHGQQVSLCVDDADIVINNDKHQSKTAAVTALEQRVERYLGLLRREPLSGPSADEIAMAMAYAQAEASECIKRHVGAVIVDRDGRLISVGFNQNPLSMQACHEQYGHCRKDDLMARHLEELEGTFCPKCGEPLSKVGAPFRCTECGLSLKVQYFPDHGVRWCPALHAEERAIALARQTNLGGCSLYTTTFPCVNCAKLITDAGIRRVVYVEPYPERESVGLLADNKVEVVPFEGVKARAFHALYKPYRAVMEDRYRLDSM
jgi:deoxycytidylate deaminase